MISCTHQTTSKLLSTPSKNFVVFAHYGLNLTKFAIGIISQILGRAHAFNLANLDFENSINEPTLGVIWNINEDTVKAQTNIKPKPFTRRGIASQIAKVHTPFSYLCSFLLPAKLIIQKIPHVELDWESPIDDVFKTKWIKGIECLPMFPLS